MDNKAHPAQLGETGGFLHRLFGQGRHEAPPGHETPSTGNATTLDLSDIQGLILRGYRMPMVRHFLLTVGVPAAARKLLGRLVSGDELDAPQITTAEDWHVGFEPGPVDKLTDAPRRKPDYCLNLGITWTGMLALEIKERIPTVSFKSFAAFVAGAAERAALVGDTGLGGPQNWTGGFGTGNDHLLVTLHAISPEAMATYSDKLCALFAEGDALREISRADGMALTEMKDGKPVFTSRVHFGYTDGISMTTIRGGPERYRPDHQQPCEPWLFVLRDEAENYSLPEPRELGLNGSFAVFKIIKTDVVGFENFLQSKKDQIDPELLAAKMCGRWRNGVPLALSPETDSPAGGFRSARPGDGAGRENGRRIGRDDRQPASQRRGNGCLRARAGGCDGRRCHVVCAGDDAEEAWRIVDPVLKEVTPVYPYEPGSWGPEAVERVTPPGGWQNPVVAQEKSELTTQAA